MGSSELLQSINIDKEVKNMQYDDELERMRARRRRSGVQKQESTYRPMDMEPDEFDDGLDIIDLDRFDYTEYEFDEPDYHPEPPRRRASAGTAGRTSGRSSGSSARRRSPEKPERAAKTARKSTQRSPQASTRKGRASQQGQGEQTMKKRKKKHRFLLVEFLILLALIGGIFYYFSGKALEGYWTIAIFGVDSRDGNLEKGALSDVEMLCVIDRKTGEMKLVSVYRDTYLQIDEDGTFHKINEAYFKGGHKQAVSALERNLDLKIDDYATFNWKAVADTINILGGIDLEITDSEFRYINGFITETVESTGIGSVHLEHAGMNHLDGVQAVAYARLRLMDTDYNRTARQRKVIQLALEKAKTADFAVLNNILVTVLPQTSTSIGIDDLIPVARNMGNYYLGTTDGFPFSRGEAKIGKRDCVIPLTLESNVIQLHQLLYGTEDYQPSSTVKKISARIASDSGMGEVAENAPKVNAGGSGGQAAAPEPTAAPTQVPETVPEETTTVEETPEETTEEETTEETWEETTEEEEQEQGPGVRPSGPSGQEPETETEKPTKPQPSSSESNGPGSTDGPGASPTEEAAKPVPESPGLEPGATGGPGDL